ncbi:hypothetical protein ASE21_02120 [Flavobacterium sp. Root901]|uniref:hypothetical protein n=1 Tax=Flavobacterium sp. Root901 TaxID=1736605 RepID=UPI00070CDB25|nr:hypothetical protein [Flavobacterium sp. Root901]KRD12725.1 hypothetical protein ASE21_02120 [Flavobacterium sp. Root901]
MKSKTTLILLLLIHIIGIKLAAQVQINAPSSYQPISIEQGGASGAYKVDIVNNNTGALNNATFSLALPAGMEYVAGSITGASQLSIANLQNPTFTLNSIPVGNTLQITFNLRINCGYSASTINYSVISGGSTIATGSSAVAGNTPSPAFLFTTVPSPQVLSTPLKTDALRTIKFKNTGVIPVTTVYIESTVTTASQSAYYKVAGANHGTVSTKTNGFRLTLTGTELQSAVTTAVGAANTSFDPGEEITIILTEQMLSCSTGNSIALNIKAGSGDSKGSLCFSDSSTAAISTAVGNPAMSVTRLTGTTYPDFCTNGKVSYTIANTGSGTASALYNLKFPWSMNFSNASLAPIIEPEAIAIKKILLNGNDVTSLVLTRNGTGSSALIPGLPNCWVINLAGLTSANGTLLQNLDGDGKYDDLPAGQSFQLDFEYGFNTSAYLTCSLNSLPLPNTGSNYFCLGSSYIDQCGVRTNRTNYPYGLLTDYTKPTFQVGAQQYNTFTASLDKAALYPGDKIILSTTFSAGLARAFVQPGKTLKTFTIILPDGLDYDASQPIRYMYTAAGAVIPASAITYNAATKTLVISPSVNLAGITASDDLLQIPLVVSGTGTVTNKTIQYSSTFAFPGCGITMPYGCSSQSLNYAVINGGCATVGTTYFDMTRATFGYVPAPSNTNVWYMPTAYVDENTPGINLHGAVSKDKVKTVFKGVVNSTAFTELWARVKYTSNAATNSSNFDKISTNASDLAGTITITKASDGSTVSGNITVADIVFSTDAVNNLQLQQVNLGAKIGSGKQINYVLQVGDQITINWFTKVSRDNLSYTYSQLANLEGDLYTKDVNGVSSDCQAIPVGFSIQRLYLALNNNSSLQAIVGQNSYRIGASVINGQNSIDVTGDHFLNEVRTYGVIRNVKATLPGIWILDTSAGKEPYYTSSLVVGNSGLYKFDPSLLSVTYVGGNTVVTFSNAALGSNGMPLSTSNLPVVSDWIGVNGSTTLAFYMLPVCAIAGPIIANVNQVFDLYTTESNGSNTENTSSTFNYGSNNTVYYNYTANSAPTLQNVDGVGSTVNWQVKVTNTSDTAAITAAGGSAALPNNWMSFVSPNNNITVTKLTNVATGTVYPAISYGTGKYWVKLGDIAASATFDVEAHYTACTNDKLQYTYNFGATGYPIDPDQGFNSSIPTCTSTQSKADLNLFPKDVNLSMTVTSPANPVQFCTNETSGENKIDYTLSVSNTAVGNAENLILEAVFPDGYSARAGTSTLTYNGITKTLKEPVYNSSRGTWEWNISADPNGISFLPWSGAGVNSFVFTYRGETSCGFASGSAVSYNIRSTSGCGKVVEYAAKGNAMQLSMKPALLNAYYLAPGVVDLKNDGSGALYQIEVTNQGVQPLSPGESIFVTMPKSLDYVTGSVIHISGASNVGEPINNVVVGNNRILNFPLPTGVIDPSNLQQNETAKFSIQLKIIDAKTLNCGLTTDAIKLDAIYSVPGVTCGVSPCDVTVITGSAKSNINVTKTTFTITPTSGIAAYASTTTNNAIIKYTINNTGTIANNTPIIIDFFNDLNGDGLYTAAKPILYSQTINDATMNIAAGASSAEQTTASFSIPESSICNIAAAIRVANNPQLCVDTVVNVPIKYESQTTAFTVCAVFR